jgi:hypothetical protein
VSRLSRIRDRVVTADAVYGTILYAALIAVSAAYEHVGDGVPGDQADPILDIELLTPLHVDYLQVIEWSASTLIVFWIAHVYARTIAGYGVREGREVRLGDALYGAVAHSNGILWSAIPATLVVLLGAVGVVPDAADWALVVNLLVLGFLGYQSLSERRRPFPLRLLGGVVTALLGLAVILIDIAMH